MNPAPVYQYQVARSTCLPTAMLNALTHLWRPDQIPGSIVRAIYRHALDCRQGAGTSTEATRRIVDEINALVAARSKRNGFHCQARYLSGPRVTVTPRGLIARTVRAGGVAVLDVCCGNVAETHAMALLKVNPRHWTFFDSCPRDRHPRKTSGIEWIGPPGIVHGANCRISVAHLNRRGNVHYALGPMAEREAVIFMTR